MDKKDNYTFEDLTKIMQALRTPETGCPWDLEQTLESIVPYTLEEAFEVANAIETGNKENLCEELGDLLLQPIYLAQIAAEQNDFTIQNVINAISNKMIDRHPHVFGDQSAQTAQDVNKIWDEKKAAKNKDTYILASVPNALPALAQAEKMQNKAAKVGFEWPDTTGVLEKLHEEINELNQAIKNKDTDNIEEELGDVLFVLTNFARMHNINPETALRKCNQKFKSRFNGMQDDTKKLNQSLSDLNLEELLTLWNTQKEN